MQMRVDLIEGFGQKFCGAPDAFLATMRVMLDEHPHDDAPPADQIACLRIEHRTTAHTTPERADEKNDGAEGFNQHTWRDVAAAWFPNCQCCRRQAPKEESVARLLVGVSQSMDCKSQIVRYQRGAVGAVTVDE